MPRVLLDLAPSLDIEDLTRACHEAWVHHGTRPGHIEACIARNPTKKGAARLRRALGSDVTLSMLETAFVKLVKAHDLPMPRTTAMSSTAASRPWSSCANCLRRIPHGAATRGR